MIKINKLYYFIKQPVEDANKTITALLIIILPIIIIVKLITILNIDKQMAELLGYLPHFFFLPDNATLVVISSMLTNLYGGLAAFSTIHWPNLLTISQASTLSLLLLFFHALPIELAITHKAGANAFLIGSLRILSGLLVAYCFVHLANDYGVYQERSIMLLGQTHNETHPSFAAWLMNQFKNIVLMCIVIYLLGILKKALSNIISDHNKRHIEGLIKHHLKIEPTIIEALVIGILFGIIYGGAIILNSLSHKPLPKSQVTVLMLFLNLFHAVIEDTALMLLLGGNLFSALWVRLISSLIIVGAVVITITLVRKSYDPQ